MQFVKSLVVARFLGPEVFGTLKSLEMVQMLDKYGNLGFNATARREIGFAKGKGDYEYERIIRNNTYSAEILLSLLLFIIGLLVSLFLGDRYYSTLLALVTVSLFLSKICNILSTEALIQKNFILISKSRVISTLCSITFILIFIYWLKLYGVILGNALLGLVGIVYFYKKLSFYYNFSIDIEQFKKIIKISIPLTFNTLSLGTFKYSERILILSLLGSKYLGFFAFASMVTSSFLTLIKTFITVRVQDLFEYLGSKKYQKAHNIVFHETLIMVIASLMVIPLIFLATNYFLPLILPEWNESKYYINFYSLILVVEIIPIHATNILNSTLVDKVNLVAGCRIFSTILLCIASYIVFLYGQLTLINFILINIFACAFYAILILIFYHKHFRLKYIVQSR